MSSVCIGKNKPFSLQCGLIDHGLMGSANLYTMDCPHHTYGQDYYPITNEKSYDIGPTKKH
jgi:hypothetical protein